MKILKKLFTGLGVAGVLFVAGCSGDGSKRSTGEFIDDTTLHAKAKAALINDPVVQGTKIDVSVDKGVVILNGAVNGDVEKRKAEDIIRGINGVRGVENNLVIRTYNTGKSADTTTGTGSSPTR
jgi:osmotically-inducible protein OsmY